MKRSEEVGMTQVGKDIAASEAGPMKNAPLFNVLDGNGCDVTWPVIPDPKGGVISEPKVPLNPGTEGCLVIQAIESHHD
jgi:hypothetical protein